MISQEMQEKLIKLAKDVEQKSYSPYSNFPVGSALITNDGDIFTGCNVENISFGLTNCGERTAIFKMISEKGPGAKIKAIAVTTKSNMPLTPCGACRQVIQEFSTPETVLLCKWQDGSKTISMKELLPYGLTQLN